METANYKWVMDALDWSVKARRKDNGIEIAVDSISLKKRALRLFLLNNDLTTLKSYTSSEQVAEIIRLLRPNLKYVVREISK